MYEEFRNIYRDAQEVLRKTHFHPAETLPISQYGLLQGLILGANCRAVLDTDFGTGFGAAAVGVAFQRLQPGQMKCSYGALGLQPELNRFMFDYLKRRFSSSMKYAQVLLTTAERFFAAQKDDSIDLALVRGEPSWERTLAHLGALNRIIRSGGFVFVCQAGTGFSGGAQRPASWEASIRERSALTWDAGCPCMLYQNRKAV